MPPPFAQLIRTLNDARAPEAVNPKQEEAVVRFRRGIKEVRAGHHNNAMIDFMWVFAYGNEPLRSEAREEIGRLKNRWRENFSETDEAERFMLLNELSNRREDAHMAALAHREMAYMYEGIQDLEEALGHMEKAGTLVPEDREVEEETLRLKNILSPPVSVMTRLRQAASKKQINLALKLSLMHDSNVVQEPINPSGLPSNKDDSSLETSLRLARTFGRKDASTGFAYYLIHQDYSEHDNLDLLIQMADCSLRRVKGNFSYLGRLATQYITTRGDRLLYKLQCSPSLFHKFSREGSWNVGVNLARTDFFNGATPDSDQIDLNAGFTWTFAGKLICGLEALVGTRDSEDATLGYEQQQFGLSFARPLAFLKSSARASLSYRQRRFEEPLPGQQEREDDLMSLGLNLSRKFSSGLDLSLRGQWQENESTLPDYHYRKTSVALGLGYNL
ncbi:MAG: hypothetical protein HQL31_12835 [Planctomycetes bacterium]|nr:hypothetical protein [Planctomycetota bacterium]